LTAAFALFAILSGPSLTLGSWALGFSTPQTSKLAQRQDSPVHCDRNSAFRLLQLDRDRHDASPGALGPTAAATIHRAVTDQQRAQLLPDEQVLLVAIRNSIVAQPRAPPFSSHAA
jgi:hypothetical protein